MKTWSFYDASTGLLSYRTLTSAHEAAVALNTPEGCVAIEGQYDALSQRVDLLTGQIVDYQPPQPDADHEWDASLRRWVLSRVAAEQLARQQAARASIEALERRELRAIREIALDPACLDADGNPVRERLRAINEEIARLRADLL